MGKAHAPKGSHTQLHQMHFQESSRDCVQHYQPKSAKCSSHTDFLHSSIISHCLEGTAQVNTLQHYHHYTNEQDGNFRRENKQTKKADAKGNYH